MEQGRGRMPPSIPPPCVCSRDTKGDGWEWEGAARGPRPLIAQPPPPHRTGQGWREGGRAADKGEQGARAAAAAA